MDEASRIVNQGIAYYNQGNCELAFQFMLQGARMGSPLAMNNLSFCYAEGIGTSADTVQAFCWMKAAAEGGFAASFYPLACKYFNGDGCPMDIGQAVIWAQRTVNEYPNDAAKAQSLLNQIQTERSNPVDTGARLYQAGRYEEAVAIFRREAEKGVALAMNNLSVCYAYGQGVPMDRREAFRWMKAAAEGGHKGAFYPLAAKYHNGDGCIEDMDQAVHWAQRAVNEKAPDTAKAQSLLNQIQTACSTPIDMGSRLYQDGRYEEAAALFRQEAEKGVPLAMNNLSVCYAYGQGVPLDQKEAFRWMKAAAEGGYRDAFYPLASRYLNGEGCPDDLNQAAHWAQRAVNEGTKHAEDAQNLLNYVQAQRANPVDEGFRLLQEGRHTEAVAIFRREAEKGDALAMNNLSVCYATGQGVPVDRSEAFRWMKAAAEGGYKGAFSPLAAKYHDGDGCTRDLDQAVHWAQRAVDEKAEDADQARMLLNQIQTQRPDPVSEGFRLFQEGHQEEGAAIFRREAEKGNALAMNNLSVCYATGQGVPMDKDEAFRWMKASAEGGYKGAFYPLAFKYSKGHGCSRDLSLATHWAQRAVDEKAANADQARRLLQAIRREVSGNRVQEGLRLYQQGHFEEAVAIYREEAKNGVPAAMNNLSVCLFNGQGVLRDWDESFRLMKAAAEKGLDISCYSLAGKYFYGYGTPRNPELAETWLNKFIEKKPDEADSAAALRENIHWMRQGPVPDFPREVVEAYQAGHRLMAQKDYAGALPLLEQAGRAGYPEALREIGDAYYSGKGVEQSVWNAYLFYQEAAFRGDAAALRSIATGIEGNYFLFLWKMYAQYSNMVRCTDVYDKAVRKYISQQNDPNSTRKGPSSPSARDAMVKVVTCWKYRSKSFEGNHVSYVLSPDVWTYMQNAAVWGNLDGLCLYTEKRLVSSPSDTLRNHRIAAYMGHSYSMCRVAQHYEETGELDVAKECYRTAARWGYVPAANWCARHNVRLNEN